MEGWKLLNEGNVFKLNQSWKVKSFTKGLELFQLVAEVAEAEGSRLYFSSQQKMFSLVIHVLWSGLI